MFGFQSCEGPSGPPGQDGAPGQDALMPQAFELNNINLTRVNDNTYEYFSVFNTHIGGELFDDENVLIYRMSGTVNPSTPIWQLIPRTVYFPDATQLVYDYDFSKVDFVITAFGNYNLGLKPEFLNNQTFRIVIIPTELLNVVDKNNFNQVMSVLELKESQIQQIGRP